VRACQFGNFQHNLNATPFLPKSKGHTARADAEEGIGGVDAGGQKLKCTTTNHFTEEEFSQLIVPFISATERWKNDTSNQTNRTILPEEAPSLCRLVRQRETNLSIGARRDCGDTQSQVKRGGGRYTWQFANPQAHSSMADAPEMARRRRLNTTRIHGGAICQEG
jgi:hypothetical protein